MGVIKVRRRAKFFLVPFMFLAVFVFCATIVCAQYVETDLVVDGGSPDTAMTIGVVAAEISSDSTLCVGAFLLDDNWEPDPCWYINEGKAAVATNPDDLPQNKNGSPKTGHFPIRFGEVYPGGYYVCDVPIEYTPGDTVYIAVHVDATDYCDCSIDPLTEEEICREETGWGAGIDFSGSNWATYFSIETEPAPEP